MNYYFCTLQSSQRTIKNNINYEGKEGKIRINGDLYCLFQIKMYLCGAQSKTTSPIFVGR
jgi:hypothetical protein